MRKIIKIITHWLSYIIPTSSDIFVFHSFPFYTDNTYAIYKYIKKNLNVRCIWLYDPEDLEMAPKGEEWPSVKYKRLSIKGIWYYYRAKYVFCSHGLNGFIELHQKDKIVNMWHGMPLKCIGCMDAKFGGTNPTKADYLVATSPAFQDVMAKSFNNMLKERVLLIGQPRNDLMYEPTDFYDKIGHSRSDYRKVGIWLPTYKQSAIGDIRSDGVFYEDGISFLNIDQLSTLNERLKEKKDLLVVKLHPMDILQQKEMPKFSNLLILKQQEFSSQLYPFLGSCDYLLTDYSSVWVDYEILNRPIGFVMNDVEQYKTSRGFTFDNLVDLLPGPIIDSLDALIAFCNTPDKYYCSRTDMFNTYRDNHASERLLKALNII